MMAPFSILGGGYVEEYLSVIFPNGLVMSADQLNHVINSSSREAVVRSDLVMFSGI